MKTYEALEQELKETQEILEAIQKEGKTIHSGQISTRLNQVWFC